VHFYVSLRWFNFEKVVDALVAKEIYHLDLDQLRTVTTQVCRIDDEEELTAMLNFYHDLGVIVKHGRTVVLQAQWLINLFKQLITVRPFNEVVSQFCIIVRLQLRFGVIIIIFYLFVICSCHTTDNNTKIIIKEQRKTKEWW